MHISSLPNELLVDIFSRLDSDLIGSLNIVNKRFNYVIERYKLYKPVAESIKFTTRKSNDEQQIKITVTATLAPKNNQIRRKNLILFISKDDTSQQIEEKITEVVQMFQLYRTRSIDVRRVLDVEFDVFEVLRNAEIGIEELEMCRSRNPRNSRRILQTPFVTKEFMDKLVARNPDRICFVNCKTALNISDIARYIKNNLKNIPNCGNWEFGYFNITERLLEGLWNEVNQPGLILSRSFFTNKSVFFLNYSNARIAFQHFKNIN